MQEWSWHVVLQYRRHWTTRKLVSPHALFGKEGNLRMLGMACAFARRNPEPLHSWTQCGSPLSADESTDVGIVAQQSLSNFTLSGLWKQLALWRTFLLRWVNNVYAKQSHYTRGLTSTNDIVRFVRKRLVFNSLCIVVDLSSYTL